MREGYDTIFRQIEQGRLNWNDKLDVKLHEHLDYRANVIVCNKIALPEGPPRNENKKAQVDRKTVNNETGAKEKVIYCLEYNLGTCPHADN